MNYSLRDYQIEAARQVDALVNSSFNRILLVSPTGSGKTVIAAHLIEKYQALGGILFLAHRSELIDQCSRKLDDIGVPHGIIKAGHWRVNNEPVQIASIQTLHARRGYVDLSHFRLCVIDEAHHAAAKTYKTILDMMPTGTPTLGLTATPYRSDGKGLGDLFTGLIQVCTIGNLIRHGYLVRPRNFIGRQPDLSNVGIRCGEYVESELVNACDRDVLLGNIVGEWSKHAAGRQTVVFAVNRKHSQDIVNMFNDCGVTAEHVDGTTPDAERSAILGRLASGETTVVSNCNLLTEGWDCPIVSAIVGARPCKSRNLWRQMGGRGLRPLNGKQDCLILDHAGWTEEHGFLTDPDKISLKGGLEGMTREVRGRECPHCNAMLKSWPPYCPSCGLELPRPEGRDIQYDDSISLTEVHPEDQEVLFADYDPGKLTNERRAYFSHLAQDMFNRNCPARHVAENFRRKYNEWPSADDMSTSSVKIGWQRVAGGRSACVYL